MPNTAGWRGGLGVKEVEARFNPAFGFVSRSGVRDQSAEVGYTWFKSGALQQIFSGLDFQVIDLLAGELQTKKISATPIEVQTPGRDILKIRYIANEENVLAPFVLYKDQTRTVAVSPSVYNFDRYGFDIETGSQRKVSGTFQYRAGDFYGGDRLFYDASVNFKPSKYFSIGARYEWNDIELPEGDFITRLVSLTTGWTFSSQLSWVTLFQYDNLSEVLGINSRLHWIPREGREGFIVLNHNVQDFDKNDSFSSMTSDLTMKFSYTFRF